jgi:Arc/MetJ-type ribon-helix-helix transcriptional regulator
MTITLSVEQERLIDQAIESGGYKNANDVIARALEILRAEESFLHEERFAIDAKIERAMAQIESGESFTAEESSVDLAARKASWRKLASR